MLNCDCYIAVREIIQLYTKKSSGSLKNIICKTCSQVVYIYLKYMYKEYLALNNKQ